MIKLPLFLMLALPTLLLLLRFLFPKRLPWFAVIVLQILGGWGLVKFALWLFAQSIWWLMVPWDDSMTFYLLWLWSFIIFLMVLPVYGLLTFVFSRIKVKAKGSVRE
jgi:hypothetical protein